MSTKKRALDGGTSEHKAKKAKTTTSKAPAAAAPTTLVADEVDFPRGGGTSFTPLEVKKIRAEATKEADAELFKEGQAAAKASKKKRKSEAKEIKDFADTDSKSRSRIELLNYKRINVGMKIFGQIVAVYPLALVVSLPNQLFGHVPITGISPQFTTRLEQMEEEDPDAMVEDEDEEAQIQRVGVPELSELFSVGQYVRTVVTAVHAPGSTDVSGIGRTRDDASKASKRVELSLSPEGVNSEVKKADLKSGFTLTASVKSKEDHGYILDFGIPDVSGFLSSKDAEAVSSRPLFIGEVLDVTISKVSSNGRTYTVTLGGSSFFTSYLTEVSSVSSILPGALVQGLLTETDKHGVYLQVLGFFDGTVDLFHLGQDKSLYKKGKKIRARVLYNYSTSPPKFALALSKHIVDLSSKQVEKDDGSSERLQDAFPVGTILDSAKVLRIEPERGLIVEVAPSIEGFVHISHISDDHVVSLSTSGPWKVGSLHPARVTGYFAFDGLLQLSMKPSVIQQKFMQVSDVEVGQVVKATIKKLTDSGLFVSLSGGIDGVIWPNHYADILLKHPGKRFKEGGQLRCRILVVDPERKRICLTAKKTLVDSELPILSKLEDFVPGKVTHAVVFKHQERHLLVEFYNNIKAVVPIREVSDLPVDITTAFPIGKVVRVRILSTEDGRIMASIKQSSASHDIPDISSVEVGDSVDGTISEVHKDNAVLSLKPSGVRALISLKNLSNHRHVPVAQLRGSLSVGESLPDLVVVTRNPEKGFVIVANKPKGKPSLSTKGASLTLDAVTVGQPVVGRVARHTPQGALIKISARIGGTLHFTDVTDNYSETEPALPAVDSVVKAVVLEIDEAKRQLTLSTRPSRLKPDLQHEIVDREISNVSDIAVGQTVRGFIKNIGDHGLFVTIGRGLDTRVQIRELFDEFVKEWKGKFKLHQVVKGRILSVDTETKKIEMTFKSENAPQTRSSRVTLSSLKEGQKVDGTITRVEEYGLFVQIENTKLQGLCHKSELSDNTEADVSAALQNFRVNDRVKAVILKVDGRRISFSLKPSYFTAEELEGGEDEDVDMADIDASERDDDGSEGGEDENSDEDEGGDDYEGFEGQGEDVDSDEGEEIDLDTLRIQSLQPEASSSNQTKPRSQPSTTLSLGAGFQWTDEQGGVDDDEAPSSDEESGQPSKKKRKRKEIEQDLTADMHTRAPQSNADFERLLLGSPNSSYLWIQYMSFQLPLSEVDKARATARRALKTINFREEQERLNVWVALLNLENVYGTDEQLDETFKEAARANDSKTIHLRLASIFDQSDKVERAEEQFRKTCKKFGQSSKVWTLFAEFLLRRGSTEEARKLLPRGLQSLEKRKHLKTISRFAQLEYKYGEPERGKTLFEGIVDSHPKRWDMWLVYMDMEGGQKNIEALRNLFDRVLAMKMTSHKAKSFFKKWLDLEKRIGDEEGVEVVKQKAVEWTQKAAGTSSSS